MKRSSEALKCMCAACALDICLTNRCNMACSYCYYETLNRGRARSLSFGQVRAGLESYMRGRDLSRMEKIAIAGGEPFLNFDVVDRTAAFIRKKAGPELKIEVFTNGTLLNAERVSRLLDKGVRLVVSLDGARPANDRNRVFRAAAPVSPFDLVTRNLEALPPGAIGRMFAGMTVTANNVTRLAENVRFLRELGFREVQLNMRYLEIWDRMGMAALRLGLRRLRDYYRELALTKMRSFGDFRFGLDFLQLKEEGVPLASLPGFREFSLGPDGYFYPCGLVTTYGANGRRYRIGDLRSGPDYEKAAALRSAAADFLGKVDARHGLTEYISNPILLYFGIKLRGIDPDRLFRSTVGVFRVFGETLGQYLRAEKIMSALSRDKEFGDMDHRPPSVSAAEIKRLALRVDGGAGAPATSRNRLDHFLYSPGSAKEAVFSVPGDPAAFGAFEQLAFYSLLKASSLGKRLLVRLLPGGPVPDAGAAGFIREHGIALAGASRPPRSSALFGGDGGRKA